MYLLITCCELSVRILKVLDEEGFDDVFPGERAVPMLSPKLTSGKSTTPSAATSVPEPETESPCKVPIQTPPQC